MTDGAHLGVGAGRALETVLGGKPSPGNDEHRNPDEMRAWLLAAEPGPWDYDGDGYEQCARYVGRLILEAFLADPILAAVPTEAVYDWDADPDRGAAGMKAEFTTSRGLHAELVDRGVPITGLGLSGFQWGWAVNAARYCVELPPAPNPAIVDMTTG